MLTKYKMDKILVAVCASHIKNLKRLLFLNQMIKSYSEQSKKCHLYISISFSIELKEQVENFIKEMQNVYFINRGIIKITQFTHYRLLVDYLSTVYNPKDTYIIFSDDDDIWSKNRVLVYYNIMKIYNEACFSIENSTIKVLCVGNNIEEEEVIFNNTEHVKTCMTLKSFNIICDETNLLGHGNTENPLYDILFSATCEKYAHKYSMKDAHRLCNIDDKFMYLYRRNIDTDYDHATYSFE